MNKNVFCPMQMLRQSQLLKKSLNSPGETQTAHTLCRWIHFQKWCMLDVSRAATRQENIHSGRSEHVSKSFMVVHLVIPTERVFVRNEKRTEREVKTSDYCLTCLQLNSLQSWWVVRVPVGVIVHFYKMSNAFGDLTSTSFQSSWVNWLGFNFILEKI